MPRIGFPIPLKENERRRALLPADLASIRRPGELVFESGYGEVLGIEDAQYTARGAMIAERRVACACPVICNPKPMLVDEYFRPGTTLFGWIHAVQGRRITDALVEHQMTAIAWEEMFEGGRHTFWRNNEVSGEAAVAHAFLELGKVPYSCKAAVIGAGNVARGAIRALERAGCNIMIYDRRTVGLLRGELHQFDVIVNAVLWDVFRTDHLIYEEDLSKMKPGSMIIDISCDEAMGIESSRPTSLDDPVYWHKGILHYVVDHVPTLYRHTASESISRAVAPFIDALVEGRADKTLGDATIIREGRILDQKIIRFQKR